MGYKKREREGEGRERDRQIDSRKGRNKENDETVCTVLVGKSVLYRREFGIGCLY